MLTDASVALRRAARGELQAKACRQELTFRSATSATASCIDSSGESAARCRMFPQLQRECNLAGRIMPIKFTCRCRARIQVKEEFAGRRVKCPKCGAAFTVPQPEVSSPPPAAKKKLSVAEVLAAARAETTGKPVSNLSNEDRARALLHAKLQDRPDHLVPALRDPDRAVRSAAADRLEMQGWKPATSEERIAFYLARDYIHLAAREGIAALGPVLACVPIHQLPGFVADHGYPFDSEQWAAFRMEPTAASIPKSERANVAILRNLEAAEAIELLGKMRDARALAPLIRQVQRASGTPIPAIAAQAIRVILNAAHRSASDTDLTAIVNLPHVSWGWGRHVAYAEKAGETLYKIEYQREAADCRLLKVLARDELARRST